MIFEFGDTNKLVYFMGEQYCITGNQCKNTAFCKADKQNTLAYRVAKVENCQTQPLPENLLYFLAHGFSLIFG